MFCKLGIIKHHKLHYFASSSFNVEPNWLIINADYYPYGMVMPNRNGSAGDGYRYGFNGMEEDPEIKGSKNSYDFGARLYDPRVGRFLSMDLKYSAYPDNTPYHFSLNSPIYFKDMDGNLLVDPYGNIIYTVIPLPYSDDNTRLSYEMSSSIDLVEFGDGTITDITYSKIARVEDVLIYANDGTPIKATRVVGYEYFKKTLVWNIDENGERRSVESSINKEITASDIDPSISGQMSDPSYDCHGLTFTQGEFWIEDSDAAEILVHDNYRPGHDNNSYIVTYHATAEFHDGTVSDLGIIHSTPLNADGTVNSKRGPTEQVENVSVKSEAELYRKEMLEGSEGAGTLEGYKKVSIETRYHKYVQNKVASGPPEESNVE